MKRDNQHAGIPWQVLENAGPERLQLLGIKPPVRGDMWMYDPGAGKTPR
jgi:hypothetical protein